MNALEAYDSTIYGLFTAVLATVFFPADDPATALLLSAGSFGFGFLVRPLGGIVLGYYSDTFGRKKAVILMVVLMALSTGAIGLIPSYAQIGVAAAILVTAARLVQGFAVGGAAGSSIAYLIEIAPPGKRGLYGSWQQASQVGAFLVTTAIAATVTNLMTRDAFTSYGWRLPFILAFFTGGLGLVLRRHLPAHDTVTRHGADSAQPEAALGDTLRHNLPSVARAAGVTCLWTITAFILLIFMPTFAHTNFGIPLSDAFLSATIAAGVVVVLCPLVGIFSDRIGYRETMLVSALLLGVIAYPAFHAVALYRSLPALILAQIALALPIAGYTAPIATYLALLFPRGARSTGISLAYNLVVMTVGAFGPLIVTALTISTGNPLAPAFYVAIGAAVSAATLWFSPPTHGERRAASSNRMTDLL